MKKKLFTIFILLFSSGIFAQGVYNNGGKIVIGTGVYLCISGTGGNYRNETNVTNGSIDLSGTLNIGGNYTNNVAGSDILSIVGTASEVAFTGTTSQTLGGASTAPFKFNNLTINNSSGVVFSKADTVNGIMTLTNGLADIGNNDFIFGTSATIAGTPSASSMIVATGTGQVKKQYNAIGSFTFPVGDNNVTAKYSPVTLSFTSGTFASGAYAGVNLVNASYPDPFISGSFLNRYWNITQTGITNFTCDAMLQYLPSDVTGIESDISCLSVNPLPISVFDPANTLLHQLSASGLTSFGTFTGGPGSKTLSLKLYLEGLYIGGSLMAQSQGLTGNQFSGNTADVISVELNNSVTYATTVYTVNNINLSTAGLASLTIPATYNGSYYLTILHRNSISTVSATPVSFASSTINYDFSNQATQAFGSNEKNVGGVFLIYGGDVNQDGIVDSGDMNEVDNGSTAILLGYNAADVNCDGLVDSGDMNIVDNNSTAIVIAHLP